MVTLLANQILEMQSRLGGMQFLWLFYCPAALQWQSLIAFAWGILLTWVWVNCRLRKEPFLLGVDTSGRSTSEQQNHCWELAVAAQLICIQPCKTIVNFKCTWDLSPAKSPAFINTNQELLTVSVVALKCVRLQAFPWEILQKYWN